MKLETSLAEHVLIATAGDNLPGEDGYDWGAYGEEVVAQLLAEQGQDIDLALMAGLFAAGTAWAIGNRPHIIELLAKEKARSREAVWA